MQLAVAHRDENGYVRNFSEGRPDDITLTLFKHFYFKIGELEMKIYDVEMHDKGITCNVDIQPKNESWRTVTPLQKQALSYKSLQNLSEKNQLFLWDNKGVSYSFFSHYKSQNKLLLERYRNQYDMTKAELKLYSELFSETA